MRCSKTKTHSRYSNRTLVSSLRPLIYSFPSRKIRFIWETPVKTRKGSLGGVWRIHRHGSGMKTGLWTGQERRGRGSLGGVWRIHHHSGMGQGSGLVGRGELSFSLTEGRAELLNRLDVFFLCLALAWTRQEAVGGWMSLPISSQLFLQAYILEG